MSIFNVNNWLLCFIDLAYLQETKQNALVEQIYQNARKNWLICFIDQAYLHETKQNALVEQIYQNARKSWLICFIGKLHDCHGNKQGQKSLYKSKIGSSNLHKKHDLQTYKQLGSLSCTHTQSRNTKLINKNKREGRSVMG